MAPLKSSLAKTAKQLLGLRNTADLGLRGATQSTRFVDPPFEASGGNVANGLAPGNGYKYHTFTSPGTLTLSGNQIALEVLMVAGGGGGGVADTPSGTDGGAGGGAGGLIYVPGYEFAAGDHTITVGSGGAGVPLASSPQGVDLASAKGGNTTWGSLLTAIGGGGGGSGPSGGPANTQAPFGSGGGQGGGGSGPHPTDHKGTGSQPGAPQNIPAPSYSQYGNPGGAADNSAPHAGGGGGGAGGAGGSGNGDGNSRDGGLGRQYPQFAGPLIGLPALNPLNGYFAGGGAGGGGGPGGDATITHGADRAGGGGSVGSGGTPLEGQPAVDGTGSGGGANSGRWNPGHSGTMGPGGDGGNGIVIVRYPVS
tara:strand:+ start:130 stop:1227 length:1098 start_codon:yes stop_codon:yes gene_type:complete